MPHIGHVLTRVVKDVFLRYKSMKGYHVSPRIGGWDCHGLPVELEVEKKLGINSKEEIEKFGIEEFNRLCRESVLKYTNEWIKMSERVGFLLDMNTDQKPPNGAYVTMTNDYIESVWWSLSELFKQNKLFKGYKIVPYCARCGTSLSSHELALGYAETKDPSIYIKFNVKDSERKLLVWTTTPWTLISNLLLAVKTDARYAVVLLDEEELILAEELVPKLTPKGKVVEVLNGGDLVGLEYESLFPYAAKIKGKKHFVTHADFVSMSEGTGIVHCAPAYGEDDYLLCQQLNVPMFHPVDEKGQFNSEITAYSGQFVKDADENIIKDLRLQGKLFAKTTIEHTYPFCWRCDSPLLYYASESWFVGMSNLRKNLVDNNDQIFWKPEHLKKGRFGNFIDEAKDWALSRSRYWGTPLPIWICESCDHVFAIGSIQELKERIKGKKLPDGLDLHKPQVDNLPITCPECEGKAVREPYVIDTWYDSGAAFFAQWHYPFENEEIFEKYFPVDFITEAIDQTRGWFYTLLAVSTSVFDKPSFLSCLTMGHILAEDGSKMSTSRGNAISPDLAIGQYGADAVRYYLCNTPVWRSTRFGVNLLRDSFRSFQLLFWNIYSFFETYTSLDDWKMDKNQIIKILNRPELDQYAISALNTLIVETEAGFENLEVHKVTGAIYNYLDGVVSNWWIRQSRRRFWDQKDQEHESAYQTLYEIIRTVIQLLAPITPFLSEFVYEKIILLSEPKNPPSVHLLPYPDANDKLINKNLETDMNTIRSAIAAGRVARTSAKLKNRQPLSAATIVIPDPELLKQLQRYKDLMARELNVKVVHLVNKAGKLQSFELIPNFKSIGPNFRKESKKVVNTIQNLSETEINDLISVLSTKPKDFELKGYKLTPSDVKIRIRVIEGFGAEEFIGGLIFLNLDLSDSSLVNEGVSRDVIRRIQSMRKELNLEYDANISTKILSTNKSLIGAINEFKSLIESETLSNQLEIDLKIDKNYTHWEITSALSEKMSFYLKIKEMSE